MGSIKPECLCQMFHSSHTALLALVLTLVVTITLVLTLVLTVTLVLTLVLTITLVPIFC